MNYLDRGDADYKIAKLLISPIGNPTNDERITDQAGYHIQQAVEKAIKHLIHDIGGVSDETKAFRTHNIDALILIAEENTGFGFPEELIEISSDLTSWEAGSRYNSSVVSNRIEIENAIEVYEKLIKVIDNYEARDQSTASQETPEAAEESNL